jgi:uncharacterized membrane protein YfhO
MWGSLLGFFSGKGLTFYLILALILALSGVTLYLDLTLNKNTNLNKENAVLQGIADANRKQVEMLSADKIKLDKLVQDTLNEREKKNMEVNQVQKELRKLRNESKDVCLDKPIDPAILSKLQHKDNKGH